MDADNKIDVDATLVDLLLRFFMLGWMFFDQVQCVAFCFLKASRIFFIKITIRV